MQGKYPTYLDLSTVPGAGSWSERSRCEVWLKVSQLSLLDSSLAWHVGWFGRWWLADEGGGVT